MKKISINHKTQALIESWVFAGLGAVAFYFLAKGYDLLDGKKAVINWTVVGFLFLSGAGAPMLRKLVAKYPKLSPFANKLTAVVDARAGITPVTITTVTSASPVEVTSVDSTIPVEPLAEVAPPVVP